MQEVFASEFSAFVIENVLEFGSTFKRRNLLVCVAETADNGLLVLMYSTTHIMTIWTVNLEHHCV